MEKEKFMACRDKIVAVLEEYGADNVSASRIAASALNQIVNPCGFAVTVTFVDLPACHIADCKN